MDKKLESIEPLFWRQRNRGRYAESNMRRLERAQKLRDQNIQGDDCESGPSGGEVAAVQGDTGQEG